MENNEFRKRLRVNVLNGADFAEKLAIKQACEAKKQQEKNIKEQIKKRIYKSLEAEMIKITNDSNLSNNEKLDGLDLLWDVQKFLDKHEENVKTLNNNVYSKEK